MGDLVARALGKAALRKVMPKSEEYGLKIALDDRFDPTKPILIATFDDLETARPIDSSEYQRTVEEDCLNDLATTIGLYYPDLIVSGESLRERLGELTRSDNQLSRLRLKYGWHDARKLLPNHSRRVLVWTQYGEYRAYYDHKWKCWRTRREDLKITHWREQCGPENWPRAE